MTRVRLRLTCKEQNTSFHRKEAVEVEGPILHGMHLVTRIGENMSRSFIIGDNKVAMIRHEDDGFALVMERPVFIADHNDFNEIIEGLRNDPRWEEEKTE